MSGEEERNSAAKGCAFSTSVYIVYVATPSEPVSKRLLAERVLPEDIEGGNILKTLCLKYPIVYFQWLNQNIHWNHGKHEYKNNV